MKNALLAVGVCLLALSGLVSRAGAQPILTSFNPTAVDPMPNYYLGYQFTLSEGALVGGLGVYDHDGDGLAVPHRVSLYNSSGAILALVWVSSADDLIGTFRYAPLTLDLPAGTYYVMADVIGTDPYVYQANAIVMDPRATFNGSYYIPEAEPVGTFTQAFGLQYMSANVHLGALPAPPGACEGDADGNGVVNFADITSVLTNFNLMCR